MDREAGIVSATKVGKKSYNSLDIGRKAMLQSWGFFLVSANIAREFKCT